MHTSKASTGREHVALRARAVGTLVQVLTSNGCTGPNCVNSGAQTLKLPPPAFCPLRSAATRHHCQVRVCGLLRW